MKSRKWLGAVLTVAMSASMAVAFAACHDEPEEKVEGPETGVYYFDAGADEYTIALNNVDQFTFLVMGENKTGTYALEGETLTFDFARAEDEDIEATLSDNVITLTYNNASMRFLKKINYTVSYDAQGGGTIQSSTVVNGKTVAKPEDPERDGYTFIGWYTDTAYMTPFLFDAQPVTGNITLYAYWLETSPVNAEYTVDFDLGYDAEEAPAPVQTVEGCVITTALPVPEREGYTFVGWYVSDYDSADKLTYQYKAGMPLNADTTLFAVWQSDGEEGLAHPAVSVTETGVSWNAVEGAMTYDVSILDPDGVPSTFNGLDGTVTSQTFDFSEKKAGEYSVTVTAHGAGSATATTTRYFSNHALAPVSTFRVVEPSALVFEGVPNAQRYYLTIDCGNDEHNHANLALGSSTNYNFSNCPMQEGGIRFTVTAEADGYASSVSKTFVYNRELSMVTGLSYDAATETIRWDAVPDAMSYVVSVNGTVTDVGSVTSISVKDQPAGELSFSVYPRTTGYNSPVPSALKVTKASLGVPQNIRISGNELTWNAVSGAQSYTVRVNGTELPNVTENKVDLSAYAVSGADLAVSVRANGATSSLWSDEQQISYLAMNGGLVYTGNTLYWNPVFGATYYEIQVNDGETTRIDDISVTSAKITLTQAGNNTLRVRFGGTDYLPSDYWVETTVFAYEIAFDTRGGSAVESIYAAYGDAIELPVPESAAYDFDGWYNIPGGPANNGSRYEATVFEERSDILLYVNWHGKTFQVTYDAQGGSVTSATANVVYDEDFKLEIPANTTERDARYAFAGWYSGQNGSGERYTDSLGNSVMEWDIAANTTLYAYWAEVLAFSDTVGVSGEEAYAVQAGEDIDLVTKITIPATYNDKPVSDIHSGAFSNCVTLEEINIPNSIQLIGARSLDDSAGAFAGCTNLMNVNVYEVEGSHTVRYLSVDGVLIQNDSDMPTRIAYFPAARSGVYTIPDMVEEIPARTFASAQLTAVIIPESVNYIRQTAFYNNTDLLTVIFEDSTAETPATLLIEGYAFQGCTSLKAIELPTRLALAEGASFNDVFYGCSDLADVDVEEGHELYSSVDGLICDALGTTVIFCPYGKSGEYTIPNTITAIGESAFASRNLITGVVIGTYLDIIGINAFEDCVNLKTVTFLGSAAANEKAIGNYAFYNCTALTTVNFEDNCAVASIGDYAFAFCEELAAISIPTTTTSVGSYAFQSCVSLSSITIEGGEEELAIGDYAFSECVNITEVNLMAGVADFNFARVFDGCSLISKVNVDAANANFTDVDGVLYNKTLTEIVYYPKTRDELTYVLPGTVTKIREGAFADCTQFTSFAIGANVSFIEANAFYNCSAIEELTFASGTAALTIGEYAFAGCSGLSEIKLPDRTVSVGDYAFYTATNVTSLVLGEGDLSNSKLTTIGSYAFAQVGIAEIDIPDTVSEIGANAFDSCQNLEVVKLPSAMKVIGSAMFSNCPLLSEVEIPEGVEEIGDEAFMDASALETFTLPSTLKKIGESAFENTGVVDLTIPASVTSIADDAFLDCLALTAVTFVGGEAALTIGANAFDGCTALQSVSISANVSEIGNYAFSGCSILSKVEFKTNADGTSMLRSIGNRGFLNTAIVNLVLPEGLTTISTSAFNGTVATSGKIQTVVIPSTVTSIGSQAFYNHKSMTSLTFTDGGTGNLTIDGQAFQNCTSLKTIKFPVTLSEIESNAVRGATGLTSIEVSEANTNFVSQDGVLYKKDATGKVTSLALFPLGKTGEIAIPEGVTSIEEFNFNAAQISGVTLPSTLKTIGNYAFQNSVITSISLPEGLESIGNYAFQNAPLTSVTLPSTLTTIGNYAFGGTSLTEITLPKGITTMGTYVFQNCTSLKTVTFEEGFNPTTYTNVTSRASASTPVKGNYSFANSGVTTINLAASMTQIPMAMFFACSELTQINFAENGKLTTIGAFAFGSSNGTEDSPKMTSIEIPNTVTEICGGAFNNWQELTTVTFEEGGTAPLVLGNGNGYSNFAVKANYQNYGAFGYCTSLESITLPYRLTTVGQFAFISCSSLKAINFEQSNGKYGVTTIDYGAFRETGLETFVVPDSVTSLPYSTTYTKNTFARCLALKSVTLPVGFTEELNWRMFLACDSLEAVNVAEGNPEYYSIDGVVFNHDDELVYYPIAKASGSSYIVPDGTTAIGDYAFYHYQVNSSSSRYGYDDYAKITSITIPASVSYIGRSALQVPALETVIFAQPTGASTDADTLTIGQYAFSHYVSPATNSLPESQLKSINLPERLTSIGAAAFSGCVNLTSITIPANVVAIGTGDDVMNPQGAFYGCSGLEEVIFAPGSKLQSFENSSTSSRTGAFYNCTSLMRIEFPESLTNIPCYAFYGCSKLEEVILPAALQKIERYAFQNCKALTVVDFGANNALVSIGNYAFSGCTGLMSVELPITLESIGTSAFANCTALASVDLFPTLVSIGASAFSGCSALETFTIYGTVTSIGESAFAGCKKLDLTVDGNNTSFTLADGTGILYDSLQTSIVSLYGDLTGEVVIPDGVTSIPEGMFAGTSVTKVTLPAGITEITESMFEGCEKLTEVIMLGRVTSIGENAFANSGLKKVTIGRFVTSIGDYAFANCAALEQVTFEANGSSALSIGSYAFQNCTSLESIDMPVRLRNPDTYEVLAGIGAYAFAGCTSLTTVTFNVRGGEANPRCLSFGNYAFSNTGLTSFTMPSFAGYRSSTCPAIAFHTFDGCTDLQSFTFNYTRQDYYYVGSYAFAGCTSLKEINNIPDNLMLQSSVATFEGCTALEEITLPAFYLNGSRCFSGCTGLKTVTIYSTSNSIPTLGTSFFEGCTSLTTVNIPDMFYQINDSAFAGCTSLTSFELPAALQYLGAGVFAGCSSLTSITIDAESRYFKSVDGNILSADGTEFLQYAPGKTETAFTIPSSVTTIAEGAFEGCANLTSVTIPAGVTTVEAGAFEGWTAEQTITVSFAQDAVPAGFASGWNGAATVVYAQSAPTIPDEGTQDA